MSRVIFLPAKNPPTPADTVNPVVLCGDITARTKAQWREDRQTACGTRKGLFNIGPSEVYKLAGLCKQESPLVLEAIKRGTIQPQVPLNIERLDMGTVCENAHFEFFSMHPPIEGLKEIFPGLENVQLSRDRRMLQHPTVKPLVMNMDGVVWLSINGQQIPAVWENKTVGSYNWGQWDNGIPVQYEYQVRSYMAGTGYRYAIVMASRGFNPDTDTVYVVIERDVNVEEEILGLIMDWEVAFNGGDRTIINQAEARWESLDDTPGRAVNNYVTLNPNMDPEPINILAVSSDAQAVYEELEEARRLESEARKHKKLAESYTAKVLSAMDGHEAGTAGDYIIRVSKTRETASYEKKKIDKLPKEFVKSSAALAGDDKADLRKAVQTELEETLEEAKTKKGGNPTVKVEKTADDSAE